MAEDRARHTCYTTPEGRILVEIRPDQAMALEVAETLGLIAPAEARRIRLAVAAAEKQNGATIH